MPIKIAIFASGSGSNAENIIQYFDKKKEFLFPIILSNKANASVHNRAKKMNIPSLSFSKEEFSDGKKIIDCLEQYEIDKIVLAGFLLKIPQILIDRYPAAIINIHPALLPNYGGKGMYGDRVHQAVKEAGETESGITIHYVNENYDEGDIIFQSKCHIDATDKAENIAQKVHRLEYKHFPVVIEKLWGTKNDTEG